ncbi:hemagglutinin/amebocyte aggregation factor-like isoform X2 [Mytilus galloprovincialis]|uniref:hemagglutinin/amebocyte aggregation factor-like isoform X2 n=1 Tax=Mytilus galloprovincialis TaxID=29158 RepID=UPI003F7C006F
MSSLKMNTKAIFVTLAVIFTTCDCWLNSYDGKLEYICPNNQSVSGIRSQHDNRHEDRIFDIICRISTGIGSRCQWSGYVNGFDEFFAFQCKYHGYIHGMRSIHDNGSEDRRWDFYCCEHDGFDVTECYQTSHTNWDAYFSVDVPLNYVMRGVTSTHDNRHEDREYSFELCKLREV